MSQGDNIKSIFFYTPWSVQNLEIKSLWKPEVSLIANGIQIKIALNMIYIKHQNIYSLFLQKKSGD